MDDINNFFSQFGGNEQLWNQLKAYGIKGGREIAGTLLELFYVMKSPETSMLDKSLIGAALAYQLLPQDLMPRDKFGLLGFLDNGITIAFAYKKVKKLVTPQIRNQVTVILNQWFGTDKDEIISPFPHLNDNIQEIHNIPRSYPGNVPPPSYENQPFEDDVVID